MSEFNCEILIGAVTYVYCTSLVNTDSIVGIRIRPLEVIHSESEIEVIEYKYFEIDNLLQIPFL